MLLWPVAVQGEKAAAEIAAAIAGFNAFGRRRLPRPDLLIVARGGGSIEDLMAFNDESGGARRRRQRDPADLGGGP